MEAPVEKIAFRHVVVVVLLAAALVHTPGAFAQDERSNEPRRADITFTPHQAAAVLSAGDRSFRTGRVGEALRTFNTMFSVFPTWWIPGAKRAVADAQIGAPIDEVIGALRGLASLAPTGPWLPMLAVMAAAERGNPDDIEFIQTMSRRAMKENPEKEPFLMRTRDADVRSRYALVRAMALENSDQVGMAVAEYRSLVESRPYAIVPRVRLAQLLAVLGRVQDADRLLAEIEHSSLFPERIRKLRKIIAADSRPRPTSR